MQFFSSRQKKIQFAKRTHNEAHISCKWISPLSIQLHRSDWELSESLQLAFDELQLLWELLKVFEKSFHREIPIRPSDVIYVAQAKQAKNFDVIHHLSGTVSESSRNMGHFPFTIKSNANYPRAKKKCCSRHKNTFHSRPNFAWHRKKKKLTSELMKVAAGKRAKNWRFASTREKQSQCQMLHNANSLWWSSHLIMLLTRFMDWS